MSDEKDAGAHHGDPILTMRDLNISRAVVAWIEIARKKYGQDWLPSDADFMKSRLFWRLRTGIKPLKYPPPTAFSYPWYEVVEQKDRPHWAYELHAYPAGSNMIVGYDIGNSDGIAFISQCPYLVSKWADDSKLVPEEVTYGDYRFKVFIGPHETIRYDAATKTAGPIMIDGWWIQLIDE